jgi:OOP family OmpA-OmpF porin
MSVQSLEYTTSGGTNVDADYDDHAIFIGLRFALNPPAPAPQPVAQPAPAPAPAPVRDFLVFFDFDSDVITPQAEAILREAAANARQLGNTRIVATGHADRSGSATYNMGLSQRRAEAVRTALVRLGLQTDEIQTVAKGETDPLVATPDGVREPQNRRFQIVL